MSDLCDGMVAQGRVTYHANVNMLKPLLHFLAIRKLTRVRSMNTLCSMLNESNLKLDVPLGLTELLHYETIASSLAV